MQLLDSMLIIMEESYDNLEAFIQQDWIFTAIAFVVILAITTVVATLVSRGLRKILTQDNVALPSSSIFVNIARAVVWVTGLCFILTTCFDIDVSALIAALGVGGIALSLGLQDTISNLIGGLQVSLTKIISPGDVVVINGDTGEVTDVTWRHTTIKTLEGSEIIIPNSVINKTALKKLPELYTVKIPFVLNPHIVDLHKAEKDLVSEGISILNKLQLYVCDPKIVFSSQDEQGSHGTFSASISDTSKRSMAAQYLLQAVVSYNNSQA